MLRCIMSDLKRAFLSWRFLCGVCLCALIYLLGSVSEKGTTDILYLLDASINISAFAFLLPLAAVLPFAATWAEDLHTGYLTFVFQRIGKNQYMVARFLVTAFSGAAATVLGMFLFLAIAPVFFPYAVLPIGESTDIYYPYIREVVKNQSWLLYFAFYAYLQGISGMFWASAALTISTFVLDPQIIYLTVVLLNEILSRILFALGLDHFTCLASGAMQTDSIWQVLGISSCVFVGLSSLCFFVYQIKGRRRLKRA